MMFCSEVASYCPSCKAFRHCYSINKERHH